MADSHHNPSVFTHSSLKMEPADAVYRSVALGIGWAMAVQQMLQMAHLSAL